VRAKGWVYVWYATGEDELYNLGKDRWELNNLSQDPSDASVVKRMQNRLDQLCQPPPPDPKFHLP
jgi:hypothetical protein